MSNVLVNLNAKYVLSKMCFDSKSLPAMMQMIRATHVVDIDTDMQAQCWLNSHVLCVQRFKLSLSIVVLTCLWTVSSQLIISVERTTVFAAGTYSERIQQFWSARPAKGCILCFAAEQFIMRTV